MTRVSPRKAASLFLACSAALVLVSQVSAGAQDRMRDRTATKVRAEGMPAAKAQIDPREAMNAWTVGLAGGLLEGAPIRLATEMARVVDDGPNLHVLPIYARRDGEFELAAVPPGRRHGHHQFRRARGVQDPGASRQNRITYLLNLFHAELHVFVRPEIQSLQTSQGRRPTSTRREPRLPIRGRSFRPAGSERGQDVHPAPGALNR